MNNWSAGFLAGIVIGVSIGIAAGRKQEPWNTLSPRQKAVRMTVVGVLLTTLIAGIAVFFVVSGKLN
jgi:hypothetical protein